MATIFTKIINGEIPGEFVWKDELCVAFADISPLQPGHLLIVPREEVENYWDADPQLFAHLMQVSQLIGQAQRQAFKTDRACQMIYGFDVPHLHIHSIPANNMEQLRPKNSAAAKPEDLSKAGQAIRAELAKLGPQAARAAKAALS